MRLHFLAPSQFLTKAKYKARHLYKGVEIQCPMAKRNQKPVPHGITVKASQENKAAIYLCSHPEYQSHQMRGEQRER